MEARKEDQRAETSGKPEPKKAAQGSTSRAISTSAGAATATIVTSSGHTPTISDGLTHFDEAAKTRLNNMNQRLRRLEMQMEVLEAEMNKADRSPTGS